MENSCKTSRNTENKVLSTHSGNMADENKQKDDAGNEVEQLIRATLHIQDCIQNLILIFDKKSAGYTWLGRLKDDCVRLPGYNLDQKEISKLKNVLKEIKIYS